jgi:hypothetical protein
MQLAQKLALVVQRKTRIEMGDTFMNIKSRDMKGVVQDRLSRLNYIV